MSTQANDMTRVDVINFAIGRIQTAMFYGPDMASSQQVCIEDTLRILELAEIPALGLIRKLVDGSQPKDLPGFVMALRYIASKY